MLFSKARDIKKGIKMSDLTETYKAMREYSREKKLNNKECYCLLLLRCNY